MKRIQDFKVMDYHMFNSDNYILTLTTDDYIESVSPGNFAEIKVPDAPNVFLRRPISIFSVDSSKKTISFYIKAIGKGTIKLGNLAIGTKVNIVYPLGNSFSVRNQKKVLIVGGGSGIAPFIMLAKKLKNIGAHITFLIGAHSAGDILLTEEFGKFGDVLITTEDGSRGERGLVTDHSVFSHPLNFDYIYTCGPNPMMKAIDRIANQNGIVCEASLENMMACGIGACLCCVTPTSTGNSCVCTDGPVFNTKELQW
jgi:dihydroorotate dehydrogenase electron transfer subunit